MGEARRTLDRRRGGVRKEVCCVIRICASWLASDPVRARAAARRSGAREGSGGVRLVSFPWARVDSAVLRHNLILLGSK